MGSDESHYNVSAGSDGQSHKTVSTNHTVCIVNKFFARGRASGAGTGPLNDVPEFSLKVSFRINGPLFTRYFGVHFYEAVEM